MVTPQERLPHQPTTKTTCHSDMSVLIKGPGVYRHLQGGDYYPLPFLSASTLKDCNWNTRILDDRLKAPPRAPTEAMVFGRAFHTAVLEPDRMPYEYHILPEGHKGTTKEGKALVAEIKKAGKSPIKKSAMNQIEAMRESLLAHPWMRENYSLSKGDIELSIVSNFHGVMVKSRLDTYYGSNGGYSIDLKTTIDASIDKWRREIRSNYITQAATYRQQLREHGLPCKRFYFAAVEKSRPYNAGIHAVADRDLDEAWERVEDLLNRYAHDRVHGFPHYNTEPTIHCYSERELKI